MGNELKDRMSGADLDWYEARKFVKQKFGFRPDINGMLFLIGINEVGLVKPEFSKEEKQDLMHVALCTLFEEEGYFQLLGRDTDGWPHYEALKPLPKSELKKQEGLLKQKIAQYFKTQMVSDEDN